MRSITHDQDAGCYNEVLLGDWMYFKFLGIFAPICKALCRPFNECRLMTKSVSVFSRLESQVGQVNGLASAVHIRLLRPFHPKVVVTSAANRIPRRTSYSSIDERVTQWTSTSTRSVKLQQKIKLINHNSKLYTTSCVNNPQNNQRLNISHIPLISFFLKCFFSYYILLDRHRWAFGVLGPTICMDLFKKN